MPDKTAFKAFYSTPWVKQAIYEQCAGRNVCMRFDGYMLRHLSSKRGELGKLALAGFKPLGEVDPEKGPFIQLQACAGNVKNPADIDYWINQGVLEFIPEVHTVWDMDRSDYFVIDLDPKDPECYDFEDTRLATAVVLHTVMGQQWDGLPLKTRGIPVTGFRLRFSGNRSFHIYVDLGERTELVKIRDVVKDLLDLNLEKSMEVDAVKVNRGTPEAPVIKPIHLTWHNVRDRKDFILVDIGAIARHRCVRSLWSMHAKTGWVCCPVKDLYSFRREDAAPANVLAAGPVVETPYGTPRP